MNRREDILIKESFRVFYEKYSPGLKNFLRKSLYGDKDLADDIFQESFFRLFRFSPIGLNEYQLKSYLYKTAVRLVIDEKRSEQKKFKLPISKSFSDNNENHNVFSLDMEKAFILLSVKERSLLWLAYVEGYSHKEIGRIIGVREKSLKVLLFRARKKFASILKERGLDGGF